MAGKQTVHANLHERVFLQTFGGCRLDVSAGNDAMNMAVRSMRLDEARSGLAHPVDCPAIAKGHGVTFKKSGTERSVGIG